MNMPPGTGYDNSTGSMIHLETKIAPEILETRAAGHKQMLGLVLAEGLAFVLKNVRNSYPKAAT